jgi:hypothetical protein
MRRTLCLGLLAIGLTVVVGTAGAAAPSEGTLSIKRGDGRVALDIRGAILGRLARGELDLYIPASRNCDDLKVWGAEEEDPPEFDITTGEPFFICGFAGKGIRFRLVGSIGMEVRRGRDLFLSAVGRGTGEIDGAGWPKDGVWSLDGDEPRSLPNALRKFTLGSPGAADGEE